MRAFISYSSENKDFADLARVAFEAEGFHVLIDDDILPSSFVERALSSFVNDADLLLLLISRHSLNSEWVQFECATFMARKKENPDLQFLPIRLDDSSIPEHLARYSIADFTVPDRYPERLRQLARDLRNQHGLASPMVAPIVAGPRTSAELQRLKDLILVAVNTGMIDFKKQLSDTFEIIEKQQFLLTPKAISVKEARAKIEIWVITKHLYNDTENPAFQEAVDGNLARGIYYKYFIDRRDPVIERRLPLYEARFAKYSSSYAFITLPAGLIMPFDELVLYDPLDVGSWGYAQMKYPVVGLEDNDIFLKLSRDHSVSIAASLKHLAYPEKKVRRNSKTP